MKIHEPTDRLFLPNKKELTAAREGKISAALEARRQNFMHDTQELFAQKDYPCVAALQAYHQDEYQVGFYGSFGEGQMWQQLRSDALYFLNEQRRTGSLHLSFWAVFEECYLNEEEFESALWRELSYLTSEEDRDSDWPANATKDPLNPMFRFALGGEEFFVVGMHPHSSRQARRFPTPALIFNVFNQFDQLAKLGKYEPMVQLNRQRDLRFQGSVNPMAEKHGESWESIQFSGRTNPSTWKCPFSFLKTLTKPQTVKV